MQRKHVPALGLRYWSALCLASTYGANMGDFYAHDIGLGHVAGLPFLAMALAVILYVERFDTLVHEAYYWSSIIVIRMAATNLADFFSVDLRLSKVWVIAALTVGLMIVVSISWRIAWRQDNAKTVDQSNVLRADTGYWVSMLVAGTVGTVLGDYFSHDLHLGHANASIVLCAILGLVFLIGSRGLLWSVPFYWLTIVVVRAAGTVVGDFFANRNMLGLALSTAATGVVFIALLLLWKPAHRAEP